MPSNPGRPARIVLIGNPASRRVTSFAEAARRMGGIEVDVRSYPDLLQGRFEGPARDSLVRIESPGECAETTREILKAGIEPMEARRRIPIGVADIERLACGRGEILHPLQWYLGYARILERLEADWASAGVRWFSTPASIAVAFDKLACLERWSAVGLPVPVRYPGLSLYAEMRQAIRDRHARLFVKLRYGYSAIGAVALEWRDSLVRAITTVDVARSNGRPRLYVTKKPRVLRREFEIAWLIDTLGMEEIVVERWLPKARWNGCPFDLRVVTIDGLVRHAVGRASHSPFTNLNLDARRIAREEVSEYLAEEWSTVESISERAAAQLRGAGTLGIDIVVSPCREKFALLEANAFGDYLPGLSFAGMSTYEAELRALVAPEKVPA